MTARFPGALLDLALLPPPAVIKDVSYDATVADRLADLATRYLTRGLDVSTLMLESDPAVILQEEDGFREVFDLQAINDAAKAVMMLFARGADQDVLYALVGSRRLTVRAADPTASPPITLLREEDDDFMRRTQFALDGTAPGLSGGGYAHVALRAAAEVRRVSLIRGPGGQVTVALQGKINADGSVSNAAVSAVAAALNDDWSDDVATGSQLTDIPIVRSAVPRPYDVVAIATVPRGPSIDLVKAQSEKGLGAATVKGKLIAGKVPTDALIAAGRVAAMSKFRLVSPAADVVCGPDEVPWCRSIAVEVGLDPDV